MGDFTFWISLFVQSQIQAETKVNAKSEVVFWLVSVSSFGLSVSQRPKFGLSELLSPKLWTQTKVNPNVPVSVLLHSHGRDRLINITINFR